MEFFQFENILDTVQLLISMAYLIILLRDYRYNTFLPDETTQYNSLLFYVQYIGSPVNENALLFIMGTLFWIKGFVQLRYFEIFGALYQILGLLLQELFSYCTFYLSVLFIYAIIGVVLFNDLPEFQNLWYAGFTLFKATLKDYDVNIMDGTRVGTLIGYIYFNSYLILNITLLVNLIIAQLAYAYKKYNRERNVHFLLSTLQVREVSEVDAKNKYSAVISAPFPLNILNIVLGSIVLAAKNKYANLALLHFYYLPLVLSLAVIFQVYQILIGPFVYIKMVAHKWALVMAASSSKTKMRTMERFLGFLLFLFFGPSLIICNFWSDLVWFFVHCY